MSYQQITINVNDAVAERLADALMEHGADVVRQQVFAHLADKFVFVQIMRDVAIG